jgi:hypothetical protein
VALVTLQYVVVGLLDVLAVAFVVDQLGREPAATTLLAAAVGAGAALGGVASVTVARHHGLASSALIGALIAGVPVAVLGLAPGLGLACGLLVGYGVGKSLVTVAGQILLQRTVPDELAARVFGVNEGLIQAGTALGAALAPVLLDAAGLPVALAIAGALVPVAALAVLVPLRRLDVRAVVPGPTFDLLMSVSFLSLLPLRSLERLARVARHATSSDGDRIVEQGQRGDDFYVIAEGRAEVIIDGTQVRHLEADDGFGEIALLRASPRTATVVAEGEVDLVILTRSSFLTALTGTTHAYTTADRLAQGWLDDDLGRGSGGPR